MYHCPAKHSQSEYKVSNFIFSITGTPYNNLEDLYAADYGDYDDNNQVNEEEAVMMAPSFVSQPLDVVLNEGETIRLPCIVSRSVETLRLTSQWQQYSAWNSQSIVFQSNESWTGELESSLTLSVLISHLLPVWGRQRVSLVGMSGETFCNYKQWLLRFQTQLQQPGLLQILLEKLFGKQSVFIVQIFWWFASQTNSFIT